MDISCCRERIERLLVGLTGIIVKVIHNAADRLPCLRPIVLKLDNDHDCFRACSFSSARFLYTLKKKEGEDQWIIQTVVDREKMKS